MELSNNILIVDDEVEITKLLGEYFHLTKGYDVFTATDGKTALDLIKDRIPSVVLLDMHLPSVDGLEILKVIRKDYPTCKVIVMTAYDMEYKHKIDLLGYDGFFIKPVPLEELKNATEALLTGRPPVTSTGEDRENFFPKARITIIEMKGNIAMSLKTYFENNRQEGLYSVIYFKSGALFLNVNETLKFNPDIVLYDIVAIGNFSDFAQRIMSLANPPKEIILFGDPKFKWEEVDSFIKKGTNYIATPLTQVTVERLLRAIKDVCFKHGLVCKKSGTPYAAEGIK